MSTTGTLLIDGFVVTWADVVAATARPYVDRAAMSAQLAAYCGDDDEDTSARHRRTMDASHTAAEDALAAIYVTADVAARAAVLHERHRRRLDEIEKRQKTIHGALQKALRRPIPKSGNHHADYIAHRRLTRRIDRLMAEQARLDREWSDTLALAYGRRTGDVGGQNDG